MCVTYDYNKRLDIRAISGCLYIYIYIYIYIYDIPHIHSTNFIVITIKKYKRKIEVIPVGEGPRVAPFKGAKGSKVSKLAQRNVDF
jgi:hypothetical protein